MRKFILLLFICYTGILRGQNVNIFGHFDSITSDTCSLYLDKYHIPEYEPVYKSKILNKECLFKFQIDNPLMASFIYEKQTVQLWLEPMDSLTINIDDFTFKGQGAVHNNFLKAFALKFKNDYNDDSIKQRVLKMGIDLYENEIFNARKNQMDFLKRYDEKGKFSPSFAKYINNRIKYHYFYLLQSYPILNANANSGLVVTPLPDLLLEDVNSEMSNNHEALNCESYRNFLAYYVIYNTSKLNGFNKFTDNSISLESKMSFTNLSLKDKSKIYSIASYLNANVHTVSPYTAKLIYEMLSKAENKGEYTKLLKSKCEKQMKAKNDDGKKDNTSKPSGPENVGDIQILGTNGKNFTLNDLKGKVVYVDFWASWCGPCRAMFPYSKELHKRFSAKQLKNVVFLYISIDKTEEIWQKAMLQNELTEFKNGLVPGDWNSEIVKYFKINSIPRYMLIDKKGNIVDQNAKRPGDEGIFKDIIHLLGD